MKRIKIPIEPHFAGNYRLEYDGKYVSLYGMDKNYPLREGFNTGDIIPGQYDESVLVPCVVEARNIFPEITEVTETEIVVTLNKLP